MSSQSPQHTDWILETIDHLRKRKARPDLQRICHVVRRRFGLPTVVTEAKLEKLVDAEIVIKVDYKGSTSYRNASKWRKSMVGCAVQNSTTVSTKIIEGILELSKAKHKKSNVTNKTHVATVDLVESGPSEKTPLNTCGLDSMSISKENENDVGVTIEEIETWLTKYCEGFMNLKSPLNVVLKREIDAGRIQILEGTGTFTVSSAQKDELKSNSFKLLDQTNKKIDSKLNGNKKNAESMDKKESKHSDLIKAEFGKRDVVINQPSKRGRPPKFRPPEEAVSLVSLSYNNVKGTKLKRSTDVGDDSRSLQPKMRKKNLSSQPDECVVCSKSHQTVGKGRVETPLQCKDCAVKAHPSCLKYNSILAGRAAKGPWQCTDCKTCCVCHDSDHGDQMLFCDGCDKGYHMTCHNPRVTKKPSGLWECYDCRLENSTQGRNEFAAMHGDNYEAMRDSAPPTPSESPTPSSVSEWQQSSNFPDASKWTADEVAEYFASAGFPNEAQVFKDQEIDGIALLLLKRVDVLKGLDLKLGPGLKVNRLIQGFQNARIA